MTIHITCAGCGLEWDRDLNPRCPNCGNTDLWPAAQAVWEKARGTQLSMLDAEGIPWQTVELA